MNKKLNTALFFIVGTAVNLVLILVLSLALFLPWVVFFSRQVEPALNLVVFGLIILFAMVGGLYLYRKLVDWHMTKLDYEKYFDPIVKPKKNLRR